MANTNDPKNPSGQAARQTPTNSFGVTARPTGINAAPAVPVTKPSGTPGPAASKTNAPKAAS